mmetsp:Transcript_103470/g.297267  ORF Transcript_103470/g.297267 Transcript_103470/m.297267 type:complete len:87 (+) Transcript_103470:36-296(+)
MPLPSEPCDGFTMNVSRRRFFLRLFATSTSSKAEASFGSRQPRGLKSTCGMTITVMRQLHLNLHPNPHLPLTYPSPNPHLTLTWSG